MNGKGEKMKKALFVLSLLGIITVFSTSASAVDLKFSGELYAAGMYQDKTYVQKDVGPSTAFYFQRLRLSMDFVVSPGLSLITRADIMKRSWGAARSAPGTALDTASAGTTAENENIVFDLANVQYISPIGMFTAGYQSDYVWGTVFGNESLPNGKLQYVIMAPAGPGNVILGIEAGKDIENSYTAKHTATASDMDKSFYTLIGFYTWKGGEAGLTIRYIRDATARTYYKGDAYWFAPYLKANIGPVALQTEVNYLYGKAKMENGIPADDNKINQLIAWLDATAQLGMFHVGGTFAYVSGDDPGTTNKLEGGIIDGGLDWNPCLILFNSERSYWAGSISGHDTSKISGPMSNAYFFQLRGGVKPSDKLDITASVSYARADKEPADNWVSRAYGYEIDLIATYKITNNLSYMLGAGYLFTGDYYKGTSSNNEIENNFMAINKLTLTF